MTVPEREVIALEAAAARSEVAVAKPLSSWLDQRRLLIGAAVIGGFAVGIIENLAGTFVPYVGQELKLTVALLVIVAVLMVRPAGIFGRVAVSRV